MQIYFITHADGSCGAKVFTSFFPHDISKTDAARITKLDVEMLHHEFWKPIYFGVIVTRHKNSASIGFCTLVSVGFFYLTDQSINYSLTDRQF